MPLRARRLAAVILVGLLGVTLADLAAIVTHNGPGGFVDQCRVPLSQRQGGWYCPQ